MNKVLKLSKFLMSVGLKKESYEVYKIAQALPPGYKIDQEVAGEIGGTPAYLTEPLLKKNLELKDIFAKHYDPNFFNNFTYIHYFRGTDGGASDYVKEYGKNSGGNPMELSVVGAYNVSPCSLKSSTESSIGSIDSFAFVVDGTPTSAFYFDTVSSYYGQMNRPAWLETLRNFGIDPDEYNPKISNLHSGNIDTFFYNQDSYKMVAESVNRKSDYHEIILKNAKVKQIIVDKRMNKDEVKDFFEKIDPYWIGEDVPSVIDVILCLGNSSISGRSAGDEIVKWLDSVFIVKRNNKKELNSTLFEKLYIEYNKDLSSKENNKIRNDGIDLLIEAVSNDNIDKEAVFSVMASAVKYNGLSSNYEKDYDIKRFMEKYIDIDYRPYTATLNNIESLSKMWTDFFGGSNRYGPKSGFMMRSFSGYDDKDQYNVVTKMTEHIYKNIINNIKNKINSTSISDKKNGISSFVYLLRFLGDSGQMCYRMNLRADPRAFEYFIDMIEEASTIANQIFNDESLREIMANDEGLSTVGDVYDLSEISRAGAELSTTIVDIFRTSEEHSPEELEEKIRNSEQIMQNRRTDGRLY